MAEQSVCPGCRGYGEVPHGALAPATRDCSVCRGSGVEPPVIGANDLVPGTFVSWVWAEGAGGDAARGRDLRPIGQLVTKDTLPHLVCELGIQLLDDPSWVLDPLLMLSKGRAIYAAVMSNKPSGLTPVN